MTRVFFTAEVDDELAERLRSRPRDPLALTVTLVPDSAVLVTRERLIDALTRLEVIVPGSGPLAGKVLADSFADALLAALAEQDTPAS